MSALNLFFIYIISINLITFLAFGIDKFKAMHNMWRIKESLLITLMLIGGAVGSHFGMKTFHHKTTKAKFKYIQIISYFSFIIIIILFFRLGDYELF